MSCIVTRTSLGSVGDTDVNCCVCAKVLKLLDRIAPGCSRSSFERVVGPWSDCKFRLGSMLMVARALTFSI